MCSHHRGILTGILACCPINDHCDRLLHSNVLGDSCRSGFRAGGNTPRYRQHGTLKRDHYEPENDGFYTVTQLYDCSGNQCKREQATNVSAKARAEQKCRPVQGTRVECNENEHLNSTYPCYCAQTCSPVCSNGIRDHHNAAVTYYMLYSRERSA